MSPEIKDSGARREFGTGAVRDMAEGKGRNDLLHPGVMIMLLSAYECFPPTAYLTNPKLACKEALYRWYACENPKNLSDLALAYMCVCAMLQGKSDMYMEVDAPKSIAGPFKIFIEGTLLLAKHYEKGAKKYGDHNWSKGIPSISFYDSAHRHLDKVIFNMTDEPHLEAILFNIVGLMYNNLYRPELECKIYAGGKRKDDTKEPSTST